MFHPHEIVKHPCEFSCMYIWIFSDITKYHIEIHNRHLLKIICPCHCMFVYHVSKITENTKRSSKYICAKFIYISRNFWAHGSDNDMGWIIHKYSTVASLVNKSFIYEFQILDISSSKYSLRLEKWFYISDMGTKSCFQV